MGDLLLTLARRTGSLVHGIAEWIAGEEGDRRPWDVYAGFAAFFVALVLAVAWTVWRGGAW